MNVIEATDSFSQGLEEFLVGIRRDPGWDTILWLPVFHFCVDLKFEILSNYTSTYVANTVRSRAVESENIYV